MKPLWVAELVKQVRVFLPHRQEKIFFTLLLHSNLPPVLLGGGDLDTNVILPALSLINQNLLNLLYLGSVSVSITSLFLLPCLGFETQLQSFTLELIPHTGIRPLPQQVNTNVSSTMRSSLSARQAAPC